MRHLAFVGLAGFAAACGTTRAPFALPPHAAAALSPDAGAPPAAARPAAAALPALVGDDGYTRIRAGAFEATGDFDSLDTGIQGEIAFGQGLIPMVSAEVSLGYLQADGQGNQELEAIPLFVNGRLDVPILIFGVYGGLGVGGMYADYRYGSFDTDDWLLAGQVFAGADVGLGDLAVGLEYRYLATDETDSGLTLEGHGLLLTCTLPF